MEKITIEVPIESIEDLLELFHRFDIDENALDPEDIAEHQFTEYLNRDRYDFIRDKLSEIMFNYGLEA